MSTHTPRPWFAKSYDDMFLIENLDGEPMDRHLFLKHLEALNAATSHTQPLADLRGNFNALLALVRLEEAAKQILADIDALLSESTQ